MNEKPVNQQIKKVEFNTVETFSRISEEIHGAGNLYFHYFNPEYSYQPKDTQKKKITSYEEYMESYDDWDGDDDIEDKKNPSKNVKEGIVNDIRVMAKYLRATEEETLVFVAMFAYCLEHESHAGRRKIRNFLGVDSSKIIFVQKLIDSLEAKFLVIKHVERYRGGDEYDINPTVENAIKKNLLIDDSLQEDFDIFKFCNNVGSLYDTRGLTQLESVTIASRVMELEELYPTISFVKKAVNLLNNVYDRILLYLIAQTYIKNGDTCNANRLLNDVYFKAKDRLKVARQMMNSEHQLIKKSFIVANNAEYFNDVELELTTEMKKELLGEDYELFMVEKMNSSIILQPENIQEKQMFYDGETLKDLRMLENCLEDSKFRSMQQRMQSKGLPKGMNILFYGVPGTGKTETVMQLARKTGRGILSVDIANCKTKWYGESQKLVKRVFEDYRAVSGNLERKPILLFNEADALFSKRTDITSSTSQTDNAIQNIILDEMEHFDGILMATTNMLDNFDGAFLRRFLFKLKFNEPGLEAKMNIWKSKVEWLTDEQLKVLASKYNLTGGEIDNIVRKSVMEELLTDKCASLEDMEKWCREEKLKEKGASKIGFAC